MSPDDVLESRERAGRDRISGRWAGRPRWQRASVVTAGTMAAIAVIATMAHQDWTQQRMERRLNDTVGISAVLDVSANSMTPRGGRVDYSVTIRNEGPRRVRVTRVSIVDGGLRIADRGIGLGTFVAAGATTNVSLSVRLDCETQRPPGEVAMLRGVVNVRPLSGSLHQVAVAFAQASPLTDVADTLCNIDPNRFGELSGPVI